MTNLNEFSAVEEEYDQLKLKTEELTDDVKKLKQLLDSCHQPLEGLDKKLAPLIRDNDSLSRTETHHLQNLGKFMGKVTTVQGNEKELLLQYSYKITEDLLKNHKKEMFQGFSDIFSSFFGNSKTTSQASYHRNSFQQTDNQLLAEIFGKN